LRYKTKRAHPDVGDKVGIIHLYPNLHIAAIGELCKREGISRYVYIVDVHPTHTTLYPRNKEVNVRREFVVGGRWEERDVSTDDDADDHDDENDVEGPLRHGLQSPAHLLAPDMSDTLNLQMKLHDWFGEF